MKKKIREDIFEQKIFENEFEVDAVDYDDILWTLHDYLQNVLLTEKNIVILGISRQTLDKARFYVETLNQFLFNKISANELAKVCTDAWEMHDKEHGSNRNLLRVIVCGLYDRERAQFEKHGSFAYFEIIFATLFDLGTGYCKDFRCFSESHKKLSKYRKR